MKKWLLLLIAITVLSSILSATALKVAVLPLKRLDSPSKYIQKFLTIRDLELTFKKTDKFELMNLKTTAEKFKELDIDDIDEMENEEMAEVSRELGADVLVLGVINMINEQTFNIQFRYYSAKTDDVRSQSVTVVKEKRRRWAVLEKEFLGRLTSFIDEELDKMIRIAIQDYHTDNFNQAERGFISVLNYNPEYKQAYYYLGLIAFNRKNYDKAIENLNKALADTLTTKDVNILQALSNTYREQGNKEMMITSLTKIADLQEDEELWLNIANLYAEINQNQKAREALEKALRLNEFFVKGQYRMAFLLYDMGLFNDAIPYLEKAANDNPENDLLARRLAISYQRSGRIDEAIARYENIVQNSPANTLAYLNLTGLYRQAATEASEVNNQTLVNQYNQKTIDALNRLRSIDPENPMVYLRFADVYLATNRVKDAETNANLALSKDPTIYQPYMLLATINQRLGSDKYNQFIDLEKRAAEAFGATADRLGRERDAARTAANGFFRRADENLRAAKIRTNEPEVISDIDSKLVNIAQLINQTSRSY